MDKRERQHDPEENIRMALDALRASMWSALPGYITKVSDMGGQLTVDVQPMIPAVILNPAGKTSLVNLPLLLDCPVVFMGGGGFTLTFPLKINDEVLVVFSSRCIDAWWQSGGQTPLPTPDLRFHDLSDGFAIVGPRNKTRALAGLSTSTVQLRSDDGIDYIELADGAINVVTDGDVNVTAPGHVTVTSPLTTFTGQVVVEGLLTFQNGIAGNAGAGSNAITGTLQVHSGDVVADTIHLKTHTHSGVTAGGANTGAPNP